MCRAFAIAVAYGLLSAFALPAPAAVDRADDVAVEIEDARAGMCDGFDGLAFTFCVALCEARDCDARDADDSRCILLRRGFAIASAGATAPCFGASPASRAL